MEKLKQPTSSPILHCVADAARKLPEWFWRGMIPMGKLTLISGESGVGKSLLAAQFAAAASNSSPWNDGTVPSKASTLISAHIHHHWESPSAT